MQEKSTKQNLSWQQTKANGYTWISVTHTLSVTHSMQSTP